MLKLPGRGKKSTSLSFLSPYKKLINVVGSKKLVVQEKRLQGFEKLSGSLFSDSKKKKGIIKINNLEKSFGKNLVLKKINLEIPPGKIFGIIGESGSGKTTLLRSMIGYFKLDKGDISFDGKDISKDTTFIKNNFGFATQENSFYEKLTIQENMWFFGSLYGLDKVYLNENVDRILRLVELIAHKKKQAEKLSGGMKKRLDLACALINDPSVLILDEPTEDLDPILRQQMLNLVKNINLNGTTVIIASHLLDEVEYLCDTVAVISDGSVMTVGSPSELKDAYKKGEEIHLVLENTSHYKEYARKLKGLQLDTDGNKLIIYVPEKDNPIKVLKRILSWINKDKQKVIMADIRRPSLTEVFSDLTKNVKKGKKK
ncbi:MAG: ABC transporter ATP-binding protein [Nanoarchaeota archaeon]